MTDRISDPPRELISHDEPDAPPRNYSTAVRVGSHVFVSGMIALRDGNVVGVGDAEAQTRFVIGHIEDALASAGAVLEDIVRYRIYLTDIEDLPGVRAALTPTFGKIRPAGTLVAVSALVHPDLKVEIDADAIVGSGLTEKRSSQP